MPWCIRAQVKRHITLSGGLVQSISSKIDSQLNFGSNEIDPEAALSCLLRTSTNTCSICGGIWLLVYLQCVQDMSE